MAEFSWDDLVSGADTAAEPIAPDTYTFLVEEATYQLSKANGHPQLSIKATVVGGPHNGKAIWHRLTAADHPYPRQLFVEGVRAMAGMAHKLDFDATPESIAAPFVGKTFIGHVVEGDDYNGEKRAEIKSMKSAAPVAPVLSAEPVQATADTPPPQPLG